MIDSPITVLLNALVIIEVKQRRELQTRHSNIVLSKMDVAGPLVGAVTILISFAVGLYIDN